MALPGAATCVDDEAYIEASEKQAKAIKTQAEQEMILQGAIALQQRIASENISGYQLEIADRQMKMAERLEIHAQSFWPEMRELGDEAWNYKRQRHEYVSLPTAWEAIEVENLNEGRQEWIAEQVRLMCINPSQCDDIRWLRNASMLTVDMKNFAARQGERRVETFNDWRFELRTQVLSLGKRSANGYKTWGALSNAAGTSAGTMLAEGISATMGALGYFTQPKPMDFWGKGIRQTISAATAPGTVQVSGTPIQQRWPELDFRTSRILENPNQSFVERPPSRPINYSPTPVSTATPYGN